MISCSSACLLSPLCVLCQARDMASEWDPLDVLDATLFGQLFAQVGKWNPDALRGSSQTWITKFKGESGYDAGGHTHDTHKEE